MNRPMNKRLVDTLDSIVDKEKKMQAIIFEFLPDLSKTKAAHISMIDQIEDQVSDIEQVIGKTSRMTHFTFELQGHNMLSAMNQMEAWIQPYISESKFSDRKFDEMNNRVKAINELLKKKIGNNPITLQQIKEMKDLYELYKGLFKYDSLIDRSLTLTRTHERLTILRENRPFDMTYSEQMSSDIRRDTDILKHRIAKVSSAMRDQFNNINAKMVELENSVKSLL